MNMKYHIYFKKTREGNVINMDKCRYEVAAEGGWRFVQCSRKPKQTIDGFGFCTQHARKLFKLGFGRDSA